MSLINKVDAEIEIVNRYLNKEINLLEKEMGLNVILVLNNYEDNCEKDIFLQKHLLTLDIGAFKNIICNYSTVEFVNFIINRPIGNLYLEFKSKICKQS